MTDHAPCPFCSAANAKKVKFTWWGGLLGPKLLSQVKCLGCGKTYNGKTGEDNTAKIVIYCLVIGGICFAIVFVLFAAIGIMTYTAK